jgi:outer membrane protein
MMRLTLILLTVAVFAGGEPARSAERLGEVRGDTLIVSLPDLISAALERNEMLQASGAMAAAAAARAAGAWSGFLPRLSVSEFFLRSDDPLMAFGFKLNNRNAQPADFAPDALNFPGESNSWVTRLQLQQPLFNGGMGWYGKAAAGAAARAASFDHARARETVVLQSVQVYEGLVLGLAYREVMLAAIASGEAHERQARALVAAEMATEADLLQAQVFLGGLRQQLITVENQIAMAGEMIRLLTALETPLVLVAQAPAAAQTGVVLPDVSLVAERSDLQARKLEAEAAARMVGVARGAMLPHVNLSLERNYFSQDSMFGNDATSWNLGVYATWDVFKGLANVSALRQARAESRAAEHRFQFEQRQARHQAAQARRDVEAARARVAVAEGAVDAARASMRIVSNQYREGLISMVDLLDVQAATVQAEGDLVQAHHDFRVDLARLMHAAGGGDFPGGLQ